VAKPPSTPTRSLPEKGTPSRSRPRFIAGRTWDAHVFGFGSRPLAEDRAAGVATVEDVVREAARGDAGSAGHGGKDTAGGRPAEGRGRGGGGKHERPLSPGGHTYTIKVREKRGKKTRTLDKKNEGGWIGWSPYNGLTPFTK